MNNKTNTKFLIADNHDTDFARLRTVHFLTWHALNIQSCAFLYSSKSHELLQLLYLPTCAKNALSSGLSRSTHHELLSRPTNAKQVSFLTPNILQSYCSRNLGSIKWGTYFVLQSEMMCFVNSQSWLIMKTICLFSCSELVTSFAPILSCLLLTSCFMSQCCRGVAL